MATEIQVTMGLAFRKGATQDGIATETTSVTMTGTRYLRGRQDIGTIESALVVTGVGVGGWIHLKNLDGTNFVQIYASSGGVAFAKLLAGEGAVFPTDPGAIYYLKANTATCSIEYLLIAR